MAGFFGGQKGESSVSPAQGPGWIENGSGSQTKGLTFSPLPASYWMSLPQLTAGCRMRRHPDESMGTRTWQVDGVHGLDSWTAGSSTNADEISS